MKHQSLYEIRDLMSAIADRHRGSVIISARDTEADHKTADDLLIDVLRHLRGYLPENEGVYALDQIIEDFASLDKWYA